MRWTISLFLLIYLLQAGCGDFDYTPDKKAERLSQLRGEFQFTVNPGSELATGLARFSFSANSTGVGLPESRFFFDGKEVLPDSTEMNGVFYEIQVPAADFFREHSIELKTAEESYLEKFTPVAFVLEPGFRDAARQEDLTFGIQGVDEGEKVLVSMVDTSFDNNDLVKKFEVTDNNLVITAADLQRLSPGPISAEVSLEKKTPMTRLGLRRAVVIVRQAVAGEFFLE